MLRINDRIKDTYAIKLEKVESGRYQLVEHWKDKIYGDMENILSFISCKNSHKWDYTFYGYTETAKSLKEVLETLRKTYDF